MKNEDLIAAAANTTRSEALRRQTREAEERRFREAAAERQRQRNEALRAACANATARCRVVAAPTAPASKTSWNVIKP